jgi:hypothetical protein
MATIVYSYIIVYIRIYYGCTMTVVIYRGKERSMAEKLSKEEFIKKAIVSLRKDGYKGIHTVYSGFNEAFKKYFDGADPVQATNKLAGEDKLVIRPVKGGVMLYLPEDTPQKGQTAEDALKKMGL